MQTVYLQATKASSNLTVQCYSAYRLAINRNQKTSNTNTLSRCLHIVHTESCLYRLSPSNSDPCIRRMRFHLCLLSQFHFIFSLPVWFCVHNIFSLLSALLWHFFLYLQLAARFLRCWNIFFDLVHLVLSMLLMFPPDRLWLTWCAYSCFCQQPAARVCSFTTWFTGVSLIYIL